MSGNEEIIVGLDIGSTKVCAVIGERNGESGSLEITGVGSAPSTGMKKGSVNNIDATIRSIRQAVEGAEMMSGREAHACWTSVGGIHVNGINSRGVVAVTGRDGETRSIVREDIERVLETARAVSIPMDRDILEVIPQRYTVDGQPGVRDPLNMIGIRLEADVHIITCAMTGGRNIIKCVNEAGYEVRDLVLQTLAAGRAVLQTEEKDLGVALVDLGGGTTDVLVYLDGAPYATATIPAGGSQVTGDISILKSLSFEFAEKIKLDKGCCWEPFLEDDDEILVPAVGGMGPRPLRKSEVLEIVQPRMEELFKLARDKIERLELKRPLGAGVVLTGGGAQLLGAAELAQDIFGLPVRVGAPRAIGGLVEEYRNPAFATAVGLVLEGFDRQTRGGALPGPEGHSREPRRSKGPSPLTNLVKWIQKEFF